MFSILKHIVLILTIDARQKFYNALIDSKQMQKNGKSDVLVILFYKYVKIIERMNQNFIGSLYNTVLFYFTYEKHL